VILNGIGVDPSSPREDIEDKFAKLGQEHINQVLQKLKHKLVGGKHLFCKHGLLEWYFFQLWLNQLPFYKSIYETSTGGRQWWLYFSSYKLKHTLVEGKHLFYKDV